MIAALFLLLLVLAAVAGMAAGGISNGKKLRRRVLDQFGRRPQEDYPLEDIPAYCQLDPAPAIDHTTWADLDMDLVFRRLNSGQSAVGEQVLYAQLHRLSPPARWEELLTHLEARPQEREALWLQLARLGAEDIRVALKPILTEEYVSVLDNLPAWETGVPFTFEELAAFYRENGAGLYAKYRAFLWEEGQLVPVADPDCPHPVELLGYDQQRKQVLDNTRLLVEGKPSTNVLLFGDGGTGKSATVKSMLYLPGMENLRLIEIQKENLVGMPRLIRSLAGRRQSFILFIDDLAFDQDDKTYSSLKTILEGGLEKRPLNVAIYATSNRRHLVRQTFSDRAGDEVDAFETISEKTALAERFGLRIPYMTMSKSEYLALIDHLAGLYHVEMNREVLHAKAMEWEIRHAGRTPRVARQFIASLS